MLCNLHSRRCLTSIEGLRQSKVHLLSSDGPEWRGINCAIIRNHGWEVDDFMYDGHYVGLNLSTETLIFEARCGSDWSTVRIPSGAYWVIAEGQPFSIRHAVRCHSLNVVIDGAFMDSILGAHHELIGGIGNSGDAVSHVLQALMDNGLENGKDDARATAALSNCLMFSLAARFGNASEQPWRATLTQSQLTGIVSWIHTNLARSLSVELIASQLGMKAAPFSRAFKRGTGKAPWDFVILARLEKAVELLRQGKSASAAADECGFSDQAHLCRLFKRTYGISPALFAARYRTRACETMLDQRTIALPYVDCTLEGRA